MAAEIDLDHVAFYEKERKGIFIHPAMGLSRWSNNP
jgi:hypothetical protein